MAESSTCLRRSFSQLSPTSSREKKENPIQRALTSSVSFGRFMSESLDWEKWSAFTHNRYIEEVERYSRPGSVAEKKAYFEAHFKRRRAQALLEQQSATAAALPETNETTNCVDGNASMDLEMAQIESHVSPGNITKDVNCLDSDTSCSDPLIESMSEGSLPEEVEQVTEPYIEKSGDSTDWPMGNDGSLCGSSFKKEYSPSNGGDKNTICSSQPNERECEVSSSSSEGESQVAQRLLTKDEKAAEQSKDNSKQQNSKKRSNAISSLHMSMINFASCSGEVQKASCSGRSKLAYLRNERPRVKANKSIMFPRISTEAYEDERFKHPSATPPLQENRAKIPFGDLSSRSRIVFRKGQSPSAMPNTFGKAQSPTVPASFTFRSEERAEKRKEFYQKLELKFKLMEEEKQKLEQKVKARNVCKDSHGSAASKITEIAGDNHVTEMTSNLRKISPLNFKNE